MPEEKEKAGDPDSLNIDVKASGSEAAALMRCLDYMERKASKSEYWAKELAPLLGADGLIDRMRRPT